MKPYQPSNKVTNSGFSWLFLSSLIGGVAIGGITHFISLLVYLIILFPLGMGFAGGVVMSYAVRQGKVRNPAIAALFGVLAGLILYGTLHGGGYLQFKQVASEEITKELGQADSSQNDQIIDAYLQEKTGSTGFLGYMKHSAQQGVSIGRVGRDGANIGETGTWIYWLIELGMINALIAAIAYAAAKDPFCESCDQWYGDKERIGSVPSQKAETFLDLLQQDHLGNAGKLVDPLAGASAPNLEVHMQHCVSCKLSDLMLTVSSTSLDKKGNLSLKEAAQGTVSLSQYNKFQEAITETLAQQSGADISEEQMQSAQLERAYVTASDQFEPHGLSTTELNNLIEQLSHHREVKEAYLVQKTMEYFPEKPFYVLGVVRRAGFIESEEAEVNLLTKLRTELVLPSQSFITCLNKDKAMTKSLQKVMEKPIYSKA